MGDGLSLIHILSKSKGNVVDPYILAEKFGVDALRFFLMRTFPFGSDGNFSNELLIQTCLLYTSCGRCGACPRDSRWAL